MHIIILAKQRANLFIFADDAQFTIIGRCPRSKPDYEGHPTKGPCAALEGSVLILRVEEHLTKDCNG